MIAFRKPRFHTATRWPADETERLDLADTDFAFVAAMRSIGCDGASLQRIQQAGQRQYAKIVGEEP